MTRHKPFPVIAVRAAILSLYCTSPAPAAAEKLAEDFRHPYSSNAATGDHVIALWQFDGDCPGADRSGNGHDLTLAGGKYVTEGRFGGALESFRGWPVVDARHQAFAKNRPDLTPRGGFTIELWIKPKPEIDGYADSFLVDNRYVDNSGYQLILTRGLSPNARRLNMLLGFGKDYDTFVSDPFSCKTGEWQHIAFTYDGLGTGSFFIDGSPMGSRSKPGRTDIAPAKKPLVIGDRVGSYYHGFPGFIDQVRICKGVLEFRSLGIELLSHRRVFRRMEGGATLRIGVTNQLHGELKGIKASLVMPGATPTLRDLPTLASGQQWELVYDLDTSLRPDHYLLRTTIEVPLDPPLSVRKELPVTIVPRPLPQRMPVVMWGASFAELKRLRDIGFTHFIGLAADFKRIWEAGAATLPCDREKVASDIEKLDEALETGLDVVATLSPGSWARGKKEFWRIGPDGKPYTKRPDVCGQFPQLPKFCYNVGVSAAQAYGAHPAFSAALIHTEVRGASQLCYHARDHAAFKEFAGYDIPKGLRHIRGTPYQAIDGFPADRVIADDLPMYVYYKWFWKEGDGWNAMHTAVHDGLKTCGRGDFWTFHDPAVRVASVYGNGGQVDYLSHWTYSYPDPIRIGLCADELFSMAGGSSRLDQRVMKMTQVIWYRSQTAPAPGEEAQTQHARFSDHDRQPRGTGSVDAAGHYVADWERRLPDARFITIAPMHLREAFWTKIARPIKGIMYHGWQSLVAVKDGHSSYRYTHPQTKHELRRLVKNVAEPLGPTLVQVPDRQSDVAFLESFASQMFAGRGTYGWNSGWQGDSYLILMYAQLQPQVIYEETIQSRGLDRFKVLVLTDCDVLTKSVAQAIKRFQHNGGIVVGDENLCPAIHPDVMMQRFSRPREADVARQKLLDAAEKLRHNLDPHYTRYAQSDNPNVITRVRQYRSTDYVFLVNDLREFGDYVGHHRLVMENGLPSQTTLILAHCGVSIYDVVAHRQVEASDNGQTVRVKVNLGPCEGRLLMVVDGQIARLQLEVPETANPGENVTIKLMVLDGQGQLVDAIVPVRLTITDSDAREAEFSGYYGAKDGKLMVNVDIAGNDKPGLWQVRAFDLASGLTADAYFRVEPPR